MFRPFQQVYHFTGTMGANAAIRFKSPVDCTLEHLSMVQSNAGSGRIKLGTSADDDLFLTYTDAGVSGTPAELWANQEQFRYGETPRIRKGDIVVITIDYDGASATAAADFTLVLTFEEG